MAKRERYYDFHCPACSKGVDGGDIPDHVQGAGMSGRFEYECECGCVVEVGVEWDPSFRVISSTRPAGAGDAASREG